jgi:hypothetical protein
MRPFILRSLVCVALLTGTGGVAQAIPPRCYTEHLTANAATRIFNVSESSGPVSASLGVTAAGSGTVSVDVWAYGPPITTGSEDARATPVPTPGVPGRAQWKLMTLNTTTTMSDGNASNLTVHGLQAILTGCTTCDVYVNLCVRSY